MKFSKFLTTDYQGQGGLSKIALECYAPRWRIFRRPIKAGMHLIQNIVKATICLHNYLRLTENAGYLPTGFVDSYDEEGHPLRSQKLISAQFTYSGKYSPPTNSSSNQQNSRFKTVSTFIVYIPPWRSGFKGRRRP